MILVWLIVILLAGGVFAWLAARTNPQLCRWISLVAIGTDFVLVLGLGARNYKASLGGTDNWFEQVDWSWIPQFGIHFHLAMDGLSLLLVLLTMFLGIASVLASWTEITTGVGFFHFNVLWILARIIGVFLALDLFLFYFAWELMLVLMYFLIAIWGHEGRVYAAVKFFLFTQLSCLLMLIAILALYFAHFRGTGIYTFEYEDLLHTPLDPHTAMLDHAGFLYRLCGKAADGPAPYLAGGCAYRGAVPRSPWYSQPCCYLSPGFR